MSASSSNAGNTNLEAAADGSGNLLQIENLRVHFFMPRATVKAVDGVSFFIREKEAFGVVGESGSGKSVTCRSIVRLIRPPGEIVSGSIRFDGRDLLALPDNELQDVRGREIAMIFQDPMTALNPVQRVRNQITETLVEDDGVSRSDAVDRAVELMKLVGIPAPERRLNEYPHQFSGGMRQRVMIAIALSRNPRFLLADEPTTAVDVTIQDQVLSLLLDLQQEFGMSLLLVTHDLGVVAQTCDRVAVMYAGRIMELTDTVTLFNAPHHPYTRGLMNSVPSVRLVGQQLEPIPGFPPDMGDLPDGCRFHPRCRYATDECRVETFELRVVGLGHYSACIKDVA